MKYKILISCFLYTCSLILKTLAGFHSASYIPLKQLGISAFQNKFPHTKERMMHREGVGAEINTAMMGSTYSRIYELLQVRIHTQKFMHGMTSLFSPVPVLLFCRITGVQH